jgi:hypothetical protein
MIHKITRKSDNNTTPIEDQSFQDNDTNKTTLNNVFNQMVQSAKDGDIIEYSQQLDNHTWYPNIITVEIIGNIPKLWSTIKHGKRTFKEYKFGTVIN